MLVPIASFLEQQIVIILLANNVMLASTNYLSLCFFVFIYNLNLSVNGDTCWKAVIVEAITVVEVSKIIE